MSRSKPPRRWSKNRTDSLLWKGNPSLLPPSLNDSPWLPPNYALITLSWSSFFLYLPRLLSLLPAKSFPCRCGAASLSTPVLSSQDNPFDTGDEAFDEIDTYNPFSAPTQTPAMTPASLNPLSPPPSSSSTFNEGLKFDSAPSSTLCFVVSFSFVHCFRYLCPRPGLLLWWLSSPSK